MCVCVCVYIYIYIVHSAGRQFHLNSTNCQSKRATGPYRFPRRGLSPCYGMIAACLQKRQLLLLSEKKKQKKKQKKQPSGQPNRVSLPLMYFRAWSSSKPGPNPTALHRADPLSICYAIWHHVFSDGPMRTFIEGLTRQCDSSPTFVVQFSSVQLLSRVQLFATPWIAARQASQSITNSWSSPKPTPIESVRPSSHLTLCRPLFLLPPILPSIRVFSNEYLYIIDETNERRFILCKK